MIAPQISIQDRPPDALLVNADMVPAELKRRHQWVNWKYAWSGKKWTKHPYNPRSGRKASSTDLMTWSTLDEVLDAYHGGRYDGVGFVFSSADPYVGVDLDGCADPDTGEIALWALQVIEGLGAYTEFSPSGTGVHIIARGKLSRSGRRGPIEMYSQERFFTVTGNLAGGTA